MVSTADQIAEIRSEPQRSPPACRTARSRGAKVWSRRRALLEVAQEGGEGGDHDLVQVCYLGSQFREFGVSLHVTPLQTVRPNTNNSSTLPLVCDRNSLDGGPQLVLVCSYPAVTADV